MAKKTAYFIIPAMAIFLSIALAPVVQAASYTRGIQNANLFGVHEISLVGSNWGANPFDDKIKVRFTPESGKYADVLAFYDGGSAWKARVYVSETGNWRWQVVSQSGLTVTSSLNGSFNAYNSQALKGKLAQHPDNKRQWATASGETFFHLSDTAYRLFNKDVPEADFQKYVRDDHALGISSLRVGGLGGYREWDDSGIECGLYQSSNWCWSGTDYSRYDLERFQKTDERLEWLLNNYPDMYVQLIMFGKTSNDFGKSWFAISETNRKNTLDYMIARWGAWPQIFFQVCNDAYYANDSFCSNCSINGEFVRNVGNYFADNDPWKNLISSGPKRRVAFHPLTLPSDFSDWHSYLHIERQSEIDAAIVDYYYNTLSVPVHLYYGEDIYENHFTDNTFGDTFGDRRYFFRRMFWATLLSGGSPTYGGMYMTPIPYSQSGTKSYCGKTSLKLVGLDDIIHIKNFFQDKSIDIANFAYDDSIVTDMTPAVSTGTPNPSRPQAARRTDNREYIVYHPCPADGEIAGGNDIPANLTDQPAVRSRFETRLNPTKRPSFRVDLTQAAEKTFSVLWFRPHDGIYQQGSNVNGGNKTVFTSPWTGVDAVLYLSAAISDTAAPATPAGLTVR